ncbi:PD-(D/E)XK nuclease family protein [uncultured Campylobacter sp.]|uniref:PD-(D/E)XK nuclease family protein n=1 Tax=uncultured Campylobacter sp. TaxID=218934 RepID=UPI00261DF39B|nr:PD-(D/E)XK nuclease family protein [uncultured Campylobacter sp.]
MLNKTLFVLSSSRNVRDFYASKLSLNSLLPKAISTAEFFEEVTYVPNKRRASDTECLLHMRNAVARVENISKILNIKNEFLIFLKNSHYLFSFFKELSREKCTVANLSSADTYASYDEHLTILDNLGKIYKDSLNSSNIYDDITLSECYEINSNFISNFDRIEFRLDGILTSLEWEILTKIAKQTQLILSVDCSKFNQKTINEIVKFTSLNLEIGYNYEINLSTKSIENKTQLKKAPVINLKGFWMRSLQAAFVFDEISKMVRSGINPQNIAVILPDESFAEVLQNLDENNMLNYAMGKSLRNDPICIFLHSLKEAVIQELDYKFNPNYIKDTLSPNQILATLNSFNLSTQIYNHIKEIFYSKVSFESFESVMKLLLSDIKKSTEIAEFIETELFNIKNLLREIELKFSELLELFLLNFANKKESMTGGGLVTVMGVLESRSRAYDGVVIVDFNDSFVPKRSQKEMFLSSIVRKNAGLISHTDRENLQRFYYESLINRAKVVSICYTENEEQILSRFIKDFSEQNLINTSQISYENALNISGVDANTTPKEIIEVHNFFEYPISFSRLDTFIKCPRRYYYQYIKNVGKPKFFNEDNLEFGANLHEALQKYFESSPYKFNKDEFLQIYTNYEDTQLVLKNELFKIRLSKFEKEQNLHFQKGFSVWKCELKIRSEFNGLPIEGKIDRVDINGDEIWLIDYKSGNLDAQSFQLAFYEMLYLAEFHQEAKGYFYSLKDNKFESSNKKIDELSQILNELKELSGSQICFNQNTKNCSQWCPYQTLCLRELR